MPRRRHATTTTTTRRPTLFNRIVHPATTPKRRRAVGTAGTATGPMGTTRASRSKPTLGARIHGMAKRVLGGVTGNRRKQQAGVEMQMGAGPATETRRRRRRRMY